MPREKVVKGTAFLLSLDCCCSAPYPEGRKMLLGFLLSLDCCHLVVREHLRHVLRPFLLSLDCCSGLPGLSEGARDGRAFYYLLIAAVVCSSWGLLYGFPLFVPPLSLDVEHDLSVSV